MAPKIYDFIIGKLLPKPLPSTEMNIAILVLFIFKMYIPEASNWYSV